LPRHLYRPGAAEYHFALARFYRGRLTASDLERGERVAADGRGVQNQHLFAALRAEWELTRNDPTAALEAISVALSVVRRTGESATDYLGLRAHALARLGRTADANDALAEATRAWDGYLPRFPYHAAQASAALNDTDAAREYLLQAYRCAWGAGPPYAHAYYLARGREGLARFGEPEPQLPAFRAPTEPIPFEAELRPIIGHLKATRLNANDD
jgi:hypothetical protein